MSKSRSKAIKLGKVESVNVETKVPDASSRPAPRAAHPGAAGGINDFAPGIDLMFSLSFHPSERRNTLRARLEVAALVRRSPRRDNSPARRAPPAHPDSLVEPPPDAGQGGGSSVGPHQLYCDRENGLLLLNGQRLIGLHGINIVLLIENDDTLAVAGTDTVDADLGELRRPSASSLPTFQRALRKAIDLSRQVRDFLIPR